MTELTVDLHTTPLHALHQRLSARMVEFAGYDMPVQYPDGVLAEHRWTRESAGLFDVSHMGQAFLVGPDHATTAKAIEALTPMDARGLARGQARYTLLMNETGGVRDDLIVTRPADPQQEGALFLVVNAACKDADFAHIQANLPAGVSLQTKPDLALLALQGPKARSVMARLAAEAATLPFMTASAAMIAGVSVGVSCSGYTGEDGFEISVAADKAAAVAALLLEQEEVKPIGLGARDTLRLEAGLCLYGHDLDETTSPIEGSLIWAVAKHRREAGAFPGADRVVRDIAEKPARKRVGILLEGRAPAREGAEIWKDGAQIGVITSGSFAPSLERCIAMGYVPPAHAAPDTPLEIRARGRALIGHVTRMPFVPHRYFRG